MTLTGEPPIKDMRDGTHPAGCTYGGFSCGYWLVANGCELEHWEEHFVQADGRCPCGTEFPGAANAQVYFDKTSADEPFEEVEDA